MDSGHEIRHQPAIPAHAVYDAFRISRGFLSSLQANEPARLVRMRPDERRAAA
jgi:hypothetical protein